LSVQMVGFHVQRVLVDTGRRAEILYKDAVDKMKLELHHRGKRQDRIFIDIGILLF